MAKMTTISIKETTRQKLLVIREELGLGFTFDDAVIECWAVRKEHQFCGPEIGKLKQELAKLQEEKSHNGVSP